MIILDTNVLSALMHKTPDRAVLGWVDDQPAESIWITTISLFEVQFGLALLPSGKRRSSLQSAFAALLDEDLDRRILDFDSTAAIEAAKLASQRHRAGHNVDFRDTQIAGIALARRATVATRNDRHFSDLDVPVVNPWKA